MFMFLMFISVLLLGCFFSQAPEISYVTEFLFSRDVTSSNQVIGWNGPVNQDWVPPPLLNNTSGSNC